MGCSSPLTVDWPQEYKHCLLGNSVISGVDPVDMSYIQQEHASSALCRLVSKHPGMNIIFHLYCYDVINLSCIWLFTVCCMRCQDKYYDISF